MDEACVPCGDPVGPGIVSYVDEARLPYAFCPGCSHTRVMEQLDAALVRLQLPPDQVVIVTDIGCSGISDQYFRTHAFHGLHGRSVTYASGIKLARPEMHVIVVMGDGGCGIGGHHLLAAARRNIGVTVLVLDNMNFGMTGGQFSATTPVGGVTSTTPLGNPERPLDIAGTVALNGAGFVARATAFEPDLPSLIADAIAHDGFSLLDIWELCTAYYVPSNQFSRQALEEAMALQGLAAGRLAGPERPEYGRALRAAGDELRGQPALPSRPLPVLYDSSLDQPCRIVLAGAAGQRVRTAAGILASGAVLSGLWAASRDDYPITVRTGYSMAEIIVSPRPIEYNGAERPDVVAVIAPEGAARVRGLLATLGHEADVLLHEGVGEVSTLARTTPLGLPAGARPHVRRSLATLAAGRIVQSRALYPLEALEEATRRTQRPDVADVNLAALAALRTADDVTS